MYSCIPVVKEAAEPPVTGSQGRHMVQNLADGWTGDSEDSEETVLEQGTQSHPAHTQDKSKSIQRRIPPALYKSLLVGKV